MSEGHYIVKNITNLQELKLGDKVTESDHASITSDDKLLQLEYIEAEDEKEVYNVKPGLYTIIRENYTMKLHKTTFTDDKSLLDLQSVKELGDKIDCFFSKLHVYATFGIEIPKRSALVYGPAGTGKSTGVIQTVNRYVADGKTLAVVWPTDKFDPSDVKDFLKTFNYIGVERFIFVAEDIGGVEIDQVRMKSTASLLSLLDNKEKTFTTPIFIVATTNHPENFLGNITNRPGRFDDKIEVGNPSGSDRKKILQFFLKEAATEEYCDLIALKKYKDFSIAHVQEVVLRSAIYDISFQDSLNKVQSDIENYNKLFTKKKDLGINNHNDDSF